MELAKPRPFHLLLGVTTIKHKRHSFKMGLLRFMRIAKSALARAMLASGIASAVAVSQAGGMLESLTEPHEGHSMRATSTMRMGELHSTRRERVPDPTAQPKGDLEEASNWDNFRIAPGATHVLMDERGPGVITHIWLTFLGPEPQDWAPQGSANHQEMLLRMYWDGRGRPAVEAPVGDFFANCFGKRSTVVSLPVVVEDADWYNCYWRMPFRKSARIEIVNQSDRPISLLYYNIDWIKLKKLARRTPYFHAQYRQEYPAQNGKDYVVLETQGTGHYVGTVLAVRTRSPAWFGEGDEKIYVDGESSPSIWGTGTEDYFLSAWGLKTTSTPFFGVPYFDQWGIVGGHTSAYRWHVSDPIVFQRGIKVTLEHFGWISPDENPEHRATSWNEREDDYASVAFWYQTGESTFQPGIPPARERTLPSLERVLVAAGDFTNAVHHGKGAAVTQTLDFYSRPQLFYRPEQPEDAWVEIPFQVERKEPLRLLIQATQAEDYGRYQVLLDGKPVGEPLDFYAATLGSAEFHLLDFWPEPGPHTVRLECVGRNPQSAGYYCGIESVRLRERRPRVMTLGYDREKDWRTEPQLYR